VFSELPAFRFAKRGGHAEVPKLQEERERTFQLFKLQWGMNFPFIAGTSGGAREVSEIRKQIRKPDRLVAPRQIERPRPVRAVSMSHLQIRYLGKRALASQKSG